MERALRLHFDDVAVSGDGLWGATTEHLCREVYGSEKVTKAQRVAVLRVLHRLASSSRYANLVISMRGGTPLADRWHGQWRLSQCRPRRQGWDLEVRPAGDDPDVLREGLAALAAELDAGPRFEERQVPTGM